MCNCASRLIFLHCRHGPVMTLSAVQFYKIVPPELDVGTLADAICCRIAASHC